MADRIFALESGRGISLSTFGDSAARRLVLLCLPTGLAGSFDPDPTVSDRWGVRVIVLDRPGYASSAPLPDGEAQSVTARADDVASYIHQAETVADEVSKADFGTIGVVGWGAGATYALALAGRHPDLVDRVAIVAASAPHRVSRGDRLSGRVNDLKVPSGSTVDTLAVEVEAHPWNELHSVGIADDDPAFAALPGLGIRVDRSLGEAATQGTLGVAADLIALDDTSWADSLGDVTASTLIVTGDDDPLAGADDAAWFAKRLAGAETVTVPGAGHLVVASAWEQILAHVAPLHGGLPDDVRK